MYKINRLRDYGLILLAFFMQVFVADLLKLGAAKPNFMIIITVFFALFTDERFGFETGFICGIILDIFTLNLFGLNTILFSLSGYLIGRFNSKIYRESMVTYAITVFAASLFILSVYRLFIGIENKFLLSRLSFGFVLNPVVFLAALYTAFFGTLIHTFLCRILKLGETSVL